MGRPIPSSGRNYNPGLKECLGYLLQFRAYRTLFKSSRLSKSYCRNTVTISTT